MLEVLNYRCAFLGNATNNVAEGTALLHCLQFISKHCYTAATVEGDSRIIFDFVLGYSDLPGHDDGELRALIIKLKNTWNIARQYCAISLRWIPRSRNSIADMIATRAADYALTRAWQ